MRAKEAKKWRQEWERDVYVQVEYDFTGGNRKTQILKTGVFNELLADYDWQFAKFINIDLPIHTDSLLRPFSSVLSSFRKDFKAMLIFFYYLVLFLPAIITGGKNGSDRAMGILLGNSLAKDFMARYRYAYDK